MDTLIELGIARTDVEQAYRRFMKALGRADLAEARQAAGLLRDSCQSMAALCDVLIAEAEDVQSAG